MNTYYAESPTLRFPELIELFGDPSLQALAKAFAASPDQMTWLLKFQNQGFQVNMPPNLKDRFNGILQPIIDANFAGGAGPAFMQMTSHLRESVAYNTKRLERTQNAFRLRVARAEIFRVQGILRSW